MLITSLNALKKPGQLGFSSDYSEQMASEIFAGADFYLMPSRFEPCGLSQMMAMRYGTIPVVHETGGLKDSVRPYSDFEGIGDGFSFSKLLEDPSYSNTAKEFSDNMKTLGGAKASADAVMRFLNR